MTFNPDDPKWTAYILGELDAPERAALEGLLESSEEARTYMEELRVAAGALEMELKAELNSGLPPVIQAGATASLADAQRAAIQSAAGLNTGSNLSWFKQSLAHKNWLAGLAVAAMILLAVAIPSVWYSPRTDGTTVKPGLSASAPNTAEGIPSSPALQPEDASKLDAAAGIAASKANNSPAVQESASADKAAEESARQAPAPAGLAIGNPSGDRPIPGQASNLPLFGGSVLNLVNAAQGASSISGTVSDSSGALIPGVIVTATNTGTGVVTTALTNDSGAYNFRNLLPGPYRITASLQGFQTASVINITLGNADTQRFNLAMKLGNATGTTVDVAVNTSTIISQTSSSIGSVLTPDRVRDLPLIGGDVLNLISGLPGVASESYAGVSSNSVNTVTNGLSVDGFTGGNLPPQAQIAELGQGQVQGQGQGQGQAAGGGRGGGGGGRGGGAAAGAASGVASGALAGGAGGRGGGGRGGAAAAAPPPPPPPAPLRAATAPARTIPDNPTIFGPTGADNYGRPAVPNNASYSPITDNPFIRVSDEPLSTFSSDVDTASYSNIRRFLNQGQLPPRDAVRIEEMINYFTYDYGQPSGKDPIGALMDVASAPWNPSHRLVRIGIKGRDIDTNRRPATNLVFLIDVSGSMQPPERLPLIKSGLKMLVDNLTENDHVSIVVYAGASGVALQPTSGDRKNVITDALNRLEAGGSTNGSAGIQLAYQLAVNNFIPGGVNRVILATDGDFNVGVQNQNDLVRLIQDRAKSGVFLSVLGVGTDNLKDSTMERLADSGNGNYAYLDSLNEAHRVLVQQMGGTLVTVAKDVKLQVEFNPAVVEAYRLIGYENRVLANADFNNDRKDAGDMGAGHTVTALYEIVPRGGSVPGPNVDPLKYQAPAPVPAPPVRGGSNETLTLKIRYKDPNGTESKLLSLPLVDREGTFSKAPLDFRFAASVAEFGMILRDSPYRGNATLSDVLDNAQSGKGPDRSGYRQEFIRLVQQARSMRGVN